jgi:hypothetical protein
MCEAKPVRNLHLACCAVFALALLPLSASAHHATAVEFDVSKTVTIAGAITRLDWANPHIHVYMDVTAHDDAKVNWAVEFPSPGALSVAGLSKNSLLPGTKVILEGYLSKDKPERVACAKAITLSDGSHVEFVVGI